jgi:hypothetical protein
VGWLEPAEAVYPGRTTDATGAPLDGARRYRLRIPPGGLPVDAFWSLSIYELQPDGRTFFADNPIKRYSIGDRTRGVIRNPDGSIDVWIQHDAPMGDSASRGSNWLPAPRGPFSLVLRAYQPRSAMLNGAAPMPQIQPVD